MKLLLELDRKDYTNDMPVDERYCVRAIIQKDGRLAVQKSREGDCKIIGGGMEAYEDVERALSREIEEEAGLELVRGSIRLMGEISEKRRDLFDPARVYCCRTRFYRCQITGRIKETHMTASEIEKGFELAWMTPAEIVEANRNFMDRPWILRDTRFVEMLAEGQLK